MLGVSSAQERVSDQAQIIQGKGYRARVTKVTKASSVKCTSAQEQESEGSERASHNIILL